MRNATTLLVIALCLLSGSVFAGQEITKESLPKVSPNLKIHVTGRTDSYSTIKINIPPDTFKSMFQAWFVIPGKDKGERLRIPVQVHAIDGVRRITVSGSPDLLDRAVIQLDCKFADPRVSSIHTYDITLSSFLNGHNKREREKKGK